MTQKMRTTGKAYLVPSTPPSMHGIVQAACPGRPSLLRYFHKWGVPEGLLMKRASICDLI